MTASLAFGSYVIVCLNITPSSSNTSSMIKFSLTDDEVVVADVDVDSVDVVGCDVAVVGSDVAVVFIDGAVVGDDVVGCVKGTGPK